MAITPADRLDQRLTGHAGEDFGDTLFHFDLTFRQDVAKGFFLVVLLFRVSSDGGPPASRRALPDPVRPW
jgi:hypothetical protein